MLLLIGKTVHRWWSELSVAPSGQKTKQSENYCVTNGHFLACVWDSFLAYVFGGFVYISVFLSVFTVSPATLYCVN